METKELDNLNRDQLFEDLKGKCKSIVKRDLSGIIAFFIAILLLVYTEQRTDEPKDICYYIFWIFFFCMGVCSVLFDVQFLKKVGKQDTPDWLLHCFEKNHRYRMIIWLVTLIVLFAYILVDFDFHWAAIVSEVLVIVIFALLFYYGDGLWWYRNEKDVIEQLRELVEKK